MIDVRDPRTAFRFPSRYSAGRSGLVWLVAIALGAATAAGCESGAATGLLIEIVDGDGENPVVDVERGSLTLRVAQSGATEVLELASITDGAFDVAVPIGSYADLTTIEVLIEDDRGENFTLVGATVPFIPLEVGRVRIVVGHPGTCVPLATPHLPVAVDSPALVLHGVNLLAFGGVSAGGPRSDVDVFSPITLTLPPIGSSALATLSRAMGRSHAASLGAPSGTFNVLLVSDTNDVVFDTAARVSAARDRPAMVPADADGTAVLVELGDLGVAVLGASSITFVDRDGTTTHSRTLTVPRTCPTAARLANGILVAGGGPTGSDVFEWHPLTQDTPGSTADDTIPFGAGLPQRADASLAVSPTNDAALLLFGRSPDDESLVSGTVIVTGCPLRCAAGAAPDPDPMPLRSGAVAVVRAPLTIGVLDRPATTLIVGGEVDDDSTTPPTAVPTGATTSVSWVGATPTIAAEGGLAIPRSGHAAIPLGTSVVLVAGGTGDAGLLSDLELCF